MKEIGVSTDAAGSRFSGTFSRGSLVRKLIASLLLVSLNGCYTFQPAIGPGPGEGTTVRLYLSNEAADRVSGRVGQPINRLDGRVLSLQQDSLRMSVSWGGLYAGTAFEGRRDTLSFRNDDIFRMEVSRLSKLRTALVGLGLAAVVGVAIGWLSAGGGSSSDDGGNGDGV